jgi:hypothetical protein
MALSKEEAVLARELLVSSLQGAMTLNHGSNTVDTRNFLTAKQFEVAVKCSVEAAQAFFKKVHEI